MGTHLEPAAGRRRLVGVGRRAMAGLAGETRVQLALAGTGWQADGAPGPDRAAGGRAVPDLVIGWRPGQVPLRPPLGTHRAVRTALADHERRPITWVLADLADPDRSHDPWATTVADRAERAWGPGLCYLAGIGWDDDPRPTLGAAATGRLLRAARIRVWWGPADTLDPVRLLESVEHGCLPLQVVPTEAVDALRAELPAALAAVVTDLDGLAPMDTTPVATAAQLAAVAAVVLAGSAERDLALEVGRIHG